MSAAVLRRQRSRQAENAAKNVPALQTVQTYLVDASVEEQTRCFEDHTFNGIMFDIESVKHYPLEYIVVKSIAVRGGLGPMTVWYCEGPYAESQGSKDKWTLIYERVHEESMDHLVDLELNRPVRIMRGRSKGFYVHSARDDDLGVVYDDVRNRRGMRSGYHRSIDSSARRKVTTSKEIQIGVGRAHLHPTPFLDESPNGWGYGRGWREQREFVGRIKYGVLFYRWTPRISERQYFPPMFESIASLLIRGCRQPTSKLYQLPEEIVCYIINKFEWNWWGTDMGVAEEEEEEEIPPPEHPTMEMLQEQLGFQFPQGAGAAFIIQAYLEALGHMGHVVNDDDDEEYVPSSDDEDDDSEYERADSEMPGSDSE